MSADYRRGMKLAGRNALVTGGASGIGAAVAESLAKAGATVTIVDIDNNLLEATGRRLGVRAEILDVSSSEAWSDFIAAHDHFDLVHLNAGITTRRNVLDGPSDPLLPPLIHLTDEEYRRAIGVNVDGVVFGARAVIPGMCERRAGDIVVTASVAAFVPIPPDPIYGLTKYAVSGLVKSLTARLAEFGVCISAICPGFVDTPLIGEQAREWIAELGMPLMKTQQVVDAVAASLTRRVNGAHWIVLPDQDPILHEQATFPFPTNTQ
jgi:NAD(P)-dependent dehydrogenase (short-subunit alcohol dehydrogenase family)